MLPEGITAHGAQGVLVAEIILSTYTEYSSHFPRFRQSSSVSFQLFRGSFWRSSNLSFWVSLSISSQNLRTTHPDSERMDSKAFISAAERWYSSSLQNPSMGSTIIRPYQERSNTAMRPGPGSMPANLHK